MGSQVAEGKPSVILLDHFADNSKEMQRFLKKLPAVLFFGLLVFPLSAFCQVDTAWVRYYNGPSSGIDEVTALAVDDSGNVFVSGHSVGPISNRDYDYATIKYDRNGNELWVRRYTGLINGGWDMAEALGVDKDGNVYVTGVSGIINGYTDNADFATIKYDPQGNQLWVSRYNGPMGSEDWATAITVDESGNVYVTGSSESTYTGQVCNGVTIPLFDYLIIKYDSNGNQLWAARFSDSTDYRYYPYLVGVDKGGNVYVSGASQHCLGGVGEWATVKYDSSGNKLWVRTFSLSPQAQVGGPSSLSLDSNYNLYFAGASPDSAAWPDFITIKYDSAGNQIWMARYNGPLNNWDGASSIALDAKKNVYVCGSSGGVGTSNDITTIKYDSMGNELWVRRYNGPANGKDDGLGIVLDSAANVYVAGMFFGSDLNYHYNILKYDSAGNFLWEKQYERPVNQYVYGKISVDRNSNIYLSGNHIKNTSPYDNDYLTIKYAPLPVLKGDLNLDGVLTMADVVLMLNFTFNGNPFAAAPAAGDLNCDGKISPADFVIMLRIFFLSAPPPC